MERRSTGMRSSPSERAPFDGITRHGVYGHAWKAFAADLWKEILEDDVANGSATVAFYLTFAIFPALIFLLGLLPYLPIPHMQETIMQALYQWLPGDSASLLKETVEGVVARKHEGVLSFGAALTLWAASSGTYALMQQLNNTYDVPESRSYLRTRLLALALVLAFGFLTVLSFAVVMGGDAVDRRLAEALPWWTGAISFGYQVVRWLFVGVALSAAFSCIYYFGPDVEQDFRFITPGSVLSVALFVAASLLFKAYVSHFGNYNATYGGIGAMIVLMLWLNLLGFVTLVGSEINALLDRYAANPASARPEPQGPLAFPEPSLGSSTRKTAPFPGALSR